MRKKISLLALWIICVFALSACSLRSDAADLYKKESPLQIEVDLPDSLTAGTEVTLAAVLRQDGKVVEQAAFVHFEVWKQDGSVRYPMEEAIEIGNGVYEMPFQFESEGLYYLEVHAGNKDSIISPQHRFIVGELSADEKDSLKQGPSPAEETPEQHH